MYRIQGADQRQYGPVSADIVRQWIAQGRILGPLHGGWGVAHTTLANERNMIGSGGTGITFSAILRLARECDAIRTRRILISQVFYSVSNECRKFAVC